MDAVLLARLQFYITIGFHYLWPPMSIGLAWIIFYMMTRYKNTGEKLYGAMVRFWTHVFALSFVVGVATGITMEFQFGTNWSEYSRYVGDIFGAPLAAEGILSFFLESTFLGVMLFGWKRFSIKTNWFASLMVAVGATLSAFWIVVANSWQQTPAGYKIENGRAVLVNIWAAFFNPSTLERYFHVITGAISVGAFVMLSISAYYLIKKQHVEFAKKSFRIALVFALLTSWGQLFIGHVSSVGVWKNQPVKLAAFEGQFETEKGVGLSVIGFPSAKAEKTYFDIRIPGLLSLMLDGSLDTEVKGLKDFPKDEWPPLLIVLLAYHIMVGVGVLMIILTTTGAVLLRKGTVFEKKWLLYALVPGFLYPTLANHFGWIAAEVGRQPWVVYGILKTKDAVSFTVPAYQVAISLVGFCVIYSLLAYAFFIVLKKRINEGPEYEEEASGKEVQS